MEESVLGEGGTTYNVGFNYTINEVEETLLDSYPLEYDYYKDKEALEEALGRIREMRDTWKEVMKLNRKGV